MFEERDVFHNVLCLNGEWWAQRVVYEVLILNSVQVGHKDLCFKRDRCVTTCHI